MDGTAGSSGSPATFEEAYVNAQHPPHHGKGPSLSVAEPAPRHTWGGGALRSVATVTPNDGNATEVWSFSDVNQAGSALTRSENYLLHVHGSPSSQVSYHKYDKIIDKDILRS